jgi:hypothetical protein
MKTKDEVFKKFQEFKVLGSDNGDKYTSKEFDTFCRKSRIKEELTMPYKP